MWARPFTVIDTKQVPDTAGYSVMGDHYYLDRVLVQAVKGGYISVPNMKPQDILDAVLIHERVEKCILDADNEIDDYLSAHECATTAEHDFVKSLGATPRQYEAALEAVIKFNEKKPLDDAPQDLCCAPYLDLPDADDKRALKEMIALGNVDAAKESKEKVKYSKAKEGGDQCLHCASWMAGHVELSPCRKIDGAVRWDRWCKLWSKQEQTNGEASGVQVGAGGNSKEGGGIEGAGGGNAGGLDAQVEPGGEA